MGGFEWETGFASAAAAGGGESGYCYVLQA